MAERTDEDILLALGEDLPVGIWIARAPDGAVIRANRAFDDLVGTPARADVAAAGFAEAYGVFTRDGGRCPASRMPFARALAERRTVVSDDLLIRRRDGRHVDIRAIARPVGDPVSHVIVVLLDVTRETEAVRARGEAEQRLERAQRLEAVGTLAGGLAHEFNNLIFSIKLLGAELATGEEDAKRRAALQMIEELTERSAALTRSLLGFVRRGKQRLVRVSLNDIATSLGEMLTRTLAGIELTLELDAPDRGTVTGDQSQLEQVIVSFVLNARDARPGRIVVRTSDLSNRREVDGARSVVLEVMDDGAGVSGDVRRTGDPSRPGIGVMSAFGIIEAHGGTVEVDAGLDGRGTTMRVVFPAAGPAPATRIRTVAPDLPRGSGLVLVVDDDQMVRKVIIGLLVALGYETIEASTGRDALELYRARHDEIRVVVLDMIMPGMSGKATYQALRAIDDSVAVLLMSGHTLDEDVQEILDLGVQRFLSKPYSVATLAHAMADLTR